MPFFEHVTSFQRILKCYIDGIICIHIKRPCNACFFIALLLLSAWQINNSDEGDRTVGGQYKSILRPHKGKTSQWEMLVAYWTTWRRVYIDHKSKVVPAGKGTLSKNHSNQGLFCVPSLCKNVPFPYWLSLSHEKTSAMTETGQHCLKLRSERTMTASLLKYI